MAIVRRFVRVDGADGSIQAQDDGPGSWGVNRAVQGQYNITFPQTMTLNMAIFINCHGNPFNQNNITVPYFGSIILLSTGGCLARTFFQNTNTVDAQFLIELIGEPA